MGWTAVEVGRLRLDQKNSGRKLITSSPSLRVIEDSLAKHTLSMMSTSLGGAHVPETVTSASVEWSFTLTSLLLRIAVNSCPRARNASLP